MLNECCGLWQELGYNFCPECGAKLQQVKEAAKVFCKNCASFWNGSGGILCINKKNHVDDWYTEKGTRLNTPSEINAKNDCEWYEEKETKK